MRKNMKLTTKNNRFTYAARHGSFWRRQPTLTQQTPAPWTDHAASLLHIDGGA